MVVNWTFWGGERQVNLDGALLDDDAQAMRWKSQQAFESVGRSAVVETKPFERLSPCFVISLEVDGRVTELDAGKRSRWERS